MEKKYNKNYNKAIKYCEKGQASKALEICDEGISDNLAAAELLNLKGLILYQRGQLKEAIIVWKLNISLNNDTLAKSYVKDSEDDKKRIALYKEAEEALRNLKISKALELFNECTKSDFNYIKVNTGIALCYEKKGDYYRAKEYVDKVLKVDSSAFTANQLKSRLKNMNLEFADSSNSKRNLIISSILVFIIAAAAGGYSIINKININKKADIVVDNSVNDLSEVNDNIEKEEEVVESKEEVKENLPQVEETNTQKIDDEISFNNLSKLIENSEFENIAKVLKDVKVEELNENDKSLYDSADKLLKNEGVEEFYYKGLDYYKAKNYNSAREEFDKAYEYCSDNYLKQDIIFYRGNTASEQDQKDITKQMYEEYNKLYPEGSYIEGVLYELALLNKNSDIELAKQYVYTLSYKYPDSIYLNSKLMEILNS